MNRNPDSRVTFVPASKTLPSVLHAKVKGSPPMSSLDMQVFVRVSQNRTEPSLEQLASSNSRTGLNLTFSMAAVCPLNSTWLFGFVLSGFHTRMVLSLAPVAIRPPEAFQLIVRWLCDHQLMPKVWAAYRRTRWSRGMSDSEGHCTVAFSVRQIR